MLFHLYLLGKVSKKRVLGTARVLAYGTVVAGVFGALTVRSAVADVQTQSLELGRKLEGLQDLVHGAQEFQINGQAVYFSASRSDDSVDKVLDRFETHCDKSHAFDPIEWKSLADGKGEQVEKGGVSRFGVMRKQDPSRGDGIVMCFTKDSARNLLTALQEFQKSGDLHDLGDVRYVHAVRRPGEAQTYVQSIWTDGSFNVKSLMGEPGKDSIGSDFVNVPRPTHATRTFTAQAMNSPYAARVYESSDAPDVVLNAYSSKLLADGWSSVTSPDVNLNKMGFDGRIYMRPETSEQAVVSVTKNADTGKTMVVVAETGSTPSTNQLKTVTQ